MLIHSSIGCSMTKQALSSRIPLLITAAILAIGCGGGAWAQHPDQPVRVVVGDLDFSNPRDIERFKRRVDDAARTLCGRDGQLDFYEANACYRGVRRQCVRELSDAQRRALLATSGRIRLWAGLID
jgi:UrcA family protein